MLTEWWLGVASCAEDGALGLFFLASSELVVMQGMGMDVEGLGGSVGPGSFSWGLVVALPLPFPPTSPLLAPFAKGHWCLFMFLQDANLHPHHLHFHYDRPLVASLVAFC
jgi:hypothetical protein